MVEFWREVDGESGLDKNPLAFCIQESSHAVVTGTSFGVPDVDPEKILGAKLQDIGSWEGNGATASEAGLEFWIDDNGNSSRALEQAEQHFWIRHAKSYG
ncbi:hypothetical protein O9K51_10289 [Purpureocillium lavendulum]|uniref:Uncharacterized protein n=1 Tax=Purpureocillium lavendulum TaxID=1247861 RepID=A0AB34FEM2_9HYPO|nr:hypothetical protein O9K51_10289 [Purpureocillium lavendulum]